MKKVLFPGSFDPITYGHMDIVEQALQIFDKVLICPLTNSKKNQGLFTMDERRKIIKQLYKDTPRVEVVSVNTKIAAVDIAKNNNCSMIVKGLRNLTDFAYEIEQAKLNLEISGGQINTVALFATPSKTLISSSTVKELFELNKDISSYVPSLVEAAIKAKYKE